MPIDERSLQKHHGERSRKPAECGAPSYVRGKLAPRAHVGVTELVTSFAAYAWFDATRHPSPKERTRCSDERRTPPRCARMRGSENRYLSSSRPLTRVVTCRASRLLNRGAQGDGFRMTIPCGAHPHPRCPLELTPAKIPHLSGLQVRVSRARCSRERIHSANYRGNKHAGLVRVWARCFGIRVTRSGEPQEHRRPRMGASSRSFFFGLSES